MKPKVLKPDDKTAATAVAVGAGGGLALPALPAPVMPSFDQVAGIVTKAPHIGAGVTAICAGLLVFFVLPRVLRRFGWEI